MPFSVKDLVCVYICVMLHWEQAKPSTLRAPSETVFTKTPLRSLICMEPPSPFTSPSTFVPCVLHWLQKYQNNMYLKVTEMPFHRAVCASLSNGHENRAPCVPAWLNNLVYDFLLYWDNSCLHDVLVNFNKSFFSEELPFLRTVGMFSPLDLNNGCFPLDWHRTESLLSSCPVVENRTVKVIQAEWCTC